MPLVKASSRSNHGYAKLAISLDSNSDDNGNPLRPKKKPSVVELCDKATETTPSLFQFEIDDMVLADQNIWDEGAEEYNSSDYEGTCLKIPLGI